MNKFCVFGNPIAHSLSPIIHRMFAQQANTEIEYTKVKTTEFAKAVAQFKSSGGTGANVTVPFKELAFSLAEQLSQAAKTAKAVNTLMFKDNIIYGDNTDGLGLVYDLTEIIKLNLTAKSVLILGAGGATKGILQPLLDQKTICTIANRTKSKAEKLTLDFDVVACGLDEINGKFDLIINATASSLQGSYLNLKPQILTPNTVCYDLMYGQKPTSFMNWAIDNKCSQVYDGLGMLVSQAAFCFALWHNFNPKIKPVLEHLRCNIT